MPLLKSCEIRYRWLIFLNLKPSNFSLGVAPLQKEIAFFPLNIMGCVCLGERTSFRSFPFESWQNPNKLWGYSPNNMQLGSLSEESWKWTFALVLQGSHPHPPSHPNRPRLCADWSGPQGHQPQTHPTSNCGRFEFCNDFWALNPRVLFLSLTWWPGRMPKSRMWSSWLRVPASMKKFRLPIMEAYLPTNSMKFVSFLQISFNSSTGLQFSLSDEICVLNVN